MFFNEKYLKYKNKYLSLKNRIISQIGGSGGGGGAAVTRDKCSTYVNTELMENEVRTKTITQNRVMELVVPGITLEEVNDCLRLRGMNIIPDGGGVKHFSEDEFAAMSRDELSRTLKYINENYKRNAELAAISALTTAKDPDNVMQLLEKREDIRKQIRNRGGKYIEADGGGDKETTVSFYADSEIKTSGNAKLIKLLEVRE